MSNLEESTEDSAGQVDNDSREQDRYLPIANIIRIMKKALPNNAKVARDAKDTVQDCVSEFISFITSEASEKCQQEKRKTINGEDIIAAMNVLGFENYIEPLKVYLAKYRENEKRETQSAKKSPKKTDSVSISPPSSPSLNSSTTTTTFQPQPLHQQQHPQQHQPPPQLQQHPTHPQQHHHQQQLDLSSGSTPTSTLNNMYMNQVPDTLDNGFNQSQYYYSKQ